MLTLKWVKNSKFLWIFETQKRNGFIWKKENSSTSFVAGGGLYGDKSQSNQKKILWIV